MAGMCCPSLMVFDNVMVSCLLELLPLGIEFQEDERLVMYSCVTRGKPASAGGPMPPEARVLDA